MDMASRYDTNDKRRFERFNTESLEIACEICGRDGARVSDIGMGGAGILMDKTVDVGSACVLGVDTPEGRFRIMAKVIWTDDMPPKGHAAENRNYKIGVSFDSSSFADSKELVFKILSSN